MPTTDKSRPKRQSKDQLTYKRQPNAVCITLYDPYGAALPKDVQETAARALQTIAQNHGLLIGIANA